MLTIILKPNALGRGILLGFTSTVITISVPLSPITITDVLIINS